MRLAVEDEVPLPTALHLHGATLVIDESLLVLAPPVPLAVPPAAQSPNSDRFTVAQLAGLSMKLKEVPSPLIFLSCLEASVHFCPLPAQASAGPFISVEAFISIFDRLGAVGFGASPLLPEAWWPLGVAAYTRLAGLFCESGSPQLAWPEVVFALADVCLNFLIAFAPFWLASSHHRRHRHRYRHAYVSSHADPSSNGVGFACNALRGRQRHGVR